MTIEDRFYAKVAKTDGCWLWTGAISTTQIPYGLIKYQGRSTGAHRVAWILAHGIIPDKMEVRHTCDTPRCVRPEHLILGTHIENMHDMRARGRSSAGERSPHAVLSDSDVRAIRSLRGQYVAREVARQFAVSQSNIYCIWQRKSWRHLI